MNGSARSGSARSGSARERIGPQRHSVRGRPLVQNTSFTLGSSTETVVAETLGGSSAQVASASATGGTADHCLLDECTLAAPRLPNEVTILVRAYQIRPDGEIQVKYDPDGSRTGTPTPPSVAVAEYSCDDPTCTAALGPDLVVQVDPAPIPPIGPGTRRRGRRGPCVPRHHDHQRRGGRGVRHRGRAPAVRGRPAARVGGVRVHRGRLPRGAPLGLLGGRLRPPARSRARSS